ncbi:MAG: preprotein translocase subunit SecG [Planctomycetaceae bacterium]
MQAFAFLTQLLLLMLSVFLMIIVLLQRGRGGGLAGAFGGLGGQSAFGTKAGDVFTKITVVLAIAWVLVAGGSGFILRSAAESRAALLGEDLPEIPAMNTGEDTGETEGGSSTESPGTETSGETPVAPASGGAGESDNK